MAVEIRVPRLGWSMEEGIFTGWLKSPGAPVIAGEPLFQLEGDKAVSDVDAPGSGRLCLLETGPAAGDTLLVGDVIGYLCAEGEAPPQPGVAAAARAAESAPAPAAPAPSSGAEAPRGRPTRPRATPRARREAARRGLDWRTLAGTGNGGRIRERDVVQAGGSGPTRRLALTARRRVIAERMLQSRRETVPVTLTTTVDVTGMVALRERTRNGVALPPGYQEWVIQAVAQALVNHPLLGARWEPEGFAPAEAIDVAFAVDTPEGLLVPVLRAVDGKPPAILARETRELIERARAGRLTPEEQRGGCFTVTNLGAFGIDAFTPVIHYPQCAILGMGAIREEPVVWEGVIAVRRRMVLSLTFDHRITDGAPAARFLAEVRERLEALAPESEAPDATT